MYFSLFSLESDIINNARDRQIL